MKSDTPRAKYGKKGLNHLESIITILVATWKNALFFWGGMVQNAFNPKSDVFSDFSQFKGWQLYNKTIPTVENTDLPCTALLQEHLRSLTQHHREAAKTVRELRQAEDHRKVQEVEQSKAQEQRQKMKSQRQDLSL